MKKLLAVLLAFVLFAVPFAARWFYYYEGLYRPGDVARPDLGDIEPTLPQIEPFEDQPAALSPGTVLVDLAHDNRLDLGELGILGARLVARGQRMETVQAGDELAAKLRDARALIVGSPGSDWTADEVRQVEDFVAKGGRLLLLTDPTRFTVDFDEMGRYILDHDSPHINSLASHFGITFQSDYLYNTADHESNYRNIKLSQFGDHDLVAGLETVVFYASHSIITEEPVLIAADGETRSSTSERATDLPVAVLAADGAVLALGDLTFLTEPYNAVYDNDTWIARIADFLSGSQRTYDVADFPLFFGERVDLVFAGEALLDSDLLAGGSDLQALFDGADKALTVRDQEDQAQDTLFVGLYEETEQVDGYLAQAGVTLLITPTVTAAPQNPAEVTTTPEPTTSPITPSAEVTTATEITVTSEVTAEPEISATVEITAPAKDKIQVESLGQMVLAGTSLVMLQSHGQRQVMVVLAHTEDGLATALERLTGGNLDGCVRHEPETTTPTVLALCPSGELAEGEGSGGWQKSEPEPEPPAPTPEPTEAVTETVPLPTPEPVGEPEGNILVIAADSGQGAYDSMTGADDFAAILSARYDVTVWSMDQDGPPDSGDLFDYDLIILAFGDFDAEAAIEEMADALFTLMITEVPFVMSGAYVGEAGTEAIIRDIQVADLEHPLTEGFTAGEAIPFVSAPSGSEYGAYVLEVLEDEGGVVGFVRGPDSEEAGAPAVAIADDEASGLRIGVIGFPLYLLPEEPKSQLVLNLVGWLLSP